MRWGGAGARLGEYGTFKEGGSGVLGAVWRRSSLSMPLLDPHPSYLPSSFLFLHSLYLRILS